MALDAPHPLVQIPRQHADVMAAHAPRELRANDGAALVDLDVVLAAAQGVLDHAFHLEKIAFTHAVSILSSGSAALSTGTPGARARGKLT